MRLAPELPTLEELQARHPLSEEAVKKVNETRSDVAQSLKFGHSLLAIIGPCAMTEDSEELLEENRRIADFGKKHGITVLHRMPPWKPRTNPDDWHGLETSNPDKAFRTTAAIAEQSGNLAIEFGHTSHVQRYLSHTALGWRGSRNDGDSELLEALRTSDPSLPLALKNGMSGESESALQEARLLSEQREAPTTLLFRGGMDFNTKPTWTQEYQRVLDATKSNVIIDVAHGGEQAHDPEGKFGKSALGQLACMQSILAVARTTGVMPRGIMIEASDVKSPTDPVVSLRDAFEAIEELAEAHRQLAAGETSVAAD